MMRHVKPSMVTPKSNGLVKNQEVEIQLDLFHHVVATIFYASPIAFRRLPKTKDQAKMADEKQHLVITYRANS
jgi:acyl-coenzyme A synthetase/AMP-(fatty) acid ligase